MKTGLLLAVFAGWSLLTKGQAINTSALIFDGEQALDSVPNTEALLEGATEMSLALWAYPSNDSPSYPDFDALAGYKNEQQSDFYMIQIGTNQLEARFRNANGTAFTSLYNGFTLNTWGHYVFTYDGANTRLYHNGNLVVTTPANGTMGNPGLNFMIGAIIFSNHTAFTLSGSADEVSLWRVALSAQQIAGLMDCPPEGTEPGLVGAWRCNENGGETTEDDSPQDNPGKLLHGATWTSTAIPAYNGCSTTRVKPLREMETTLLSPNPTKGEATLSLPGWQGPVRVTVTDGLGRDVTPSSLQNVDQLSENKLALSRGTLCQGVYTLHLMGKNQTVVKRWVLE